MAFDCTFFIFLACFVISSQAEWKLCTKPEHASYCKQIEAQTTTVRCVKVEDKADCIAKLQTGSVNFGVFSAEDSVLAALHRDTSVVIGEVGNVKKPLQKYQYQAVAVVKADYGGSLSSLRGKSFCHPGFSKTQSWTDPVLKAFEIKVLGSDWKCDTNKTFVDEYHESLSKFFGRTCRPGQWSPTEYLDKKLKQKYPNLCSLCKNPATCAYDSTLDSNSPHIAALECLTERGGHVAYAALSKVREYFSKDASNKSAEQYRFLCPDGSTQALNASEPCTWVKQPWSLILADNPQNAAKISQELRNLVPDSGSRREDWTAILRKILEGADGDLRLFNSTLPSVKEYILRLRDIPRPISEKCRPKIQWCTVSSNEFAKCSIMSNAAQTYGSEPGISCTSASMFKECLLMVNTSRADITVIPTGVGYLARRVLKTEPAAYVEGSRAGHYIGVVVIPSTSSVTTLKDLKEKRACFPYFNSLGYLTYLDIMRKQNLLPKNVCPTGKHALSFFGDSCIPGIKDPKMNPNQDAIPDTVCSACSRGSTPSSSCEGVISNPYFNEGGALKCLSSGAGEVAFLNYNELKKLTSGRFGVKRDTIKLLCNNGSSVLVTDEYPPENCIHLHVIGSEIISRESDSSSRKEDIQHALEDLNDWFGSAGRFEGTFQLFGAFNETDNVLLPSTGSDLINRYVLSAPFVGDYYKLHNSLKQCSGASMILMNIVAFAMTLLFIYL